MLVVSVMAFVFLAIVGAVWILIVEIRHTLRDEIFMEGVSGFCKWASTPFRLVGESLGQLFETMVSTAQTVLWPSREKEGQNVRD